ncbi:hypothetical protein EBU95_18280 [bacterium]|nr:hypothetical protein [bacterium]
METKGGIISLTAIVIITIISTLLIIFYCSYYPPLKYLPFASLPEMQISQTISLYGQNLIQKILHSAQSTIDFNMIQGDYQRYPLGKSRMTTSVVAVNAGSEHPNMKAWHAQIDIYNFNFIWPDVHSSYWACPVIVSSNPVIVIKGQFPYCRYFSFFSYTGVELSDQGTANPGQGITENAQFICNPTIPGNCSGLRDVDIEPDEGSKNPFVDPTFEEGDDAYYTIYFVSPYYLKSGKALPKSKNILPLTVYGYDTAIILYRIYSIFNPKSCEGPFYTSQITFNTKGCPPPSGSCDLKKPNIHHISLQGNDGDSAYPYEDKYSPCKNGDTTCIKDCVKYYVGNAISQNKLPECIPFLGQNQFCICNGENIYGKCAQFYDKVMRICTNNAGDIKNFCAAQPAMKESPCINDYYQDTSECSLYTMYDSPFCESKSTKEEQDQCLLCTNSLRSQATSCVVNKLLASANPDCVFFKNPNNLSAICHTDPSLNSCQPEFVSYLYECLDINPSVDKDGKVFANFCKQQDVLQPAYTPTYSFDITPIDCSSSCQKYTCSNNQCIPNIQGEYDDPCCQEQCACSGDTSGNIRTKYSCMSPGYCKPDPNGKYPSFRDCRMNCRQDFTWKCENGVCIPSFDKSGPFSYIQQCLDHCPNSSGVESFQYAAPTTPPPTFQTIPPITKPKITTSSSDKNGCNNRVFSKDCNVLNQKWMNISNNYVNTQNADLVAATGWVGLPDVFVKYSYNDYFVRLNKEDIINTKINLIKDVVSFKKLIETNNYINPNSFLQVAEENNISGKDYDEQILSRESFDFFTDSSECLEYCDSSTYFYVGARFPKGVIGKKQTTAISPPGCNYFTDLCACENNGKQSASPCGMVVPGRLDCEGNPCFKQWSSLKSGYRFSGAAEPFSISANVGKTIIFPLPDNQYIASNTIYDERFVYIVWFDKPSTPETPSFQNIIRQDYQTRFFSVGHYYWAMELGNPRPVLSDLEDQDMKTVPIQYQDELTSKSLSSQRVCVLLATKSQHDYLTSYDLLDDNVNWLNWGKTKVPSILELIKKLKQQLPPIVGQFVKDFFDADTFIDIDNLIDSILENLQLGPFISSLFQTLKKDIQELKTPLYGLLLIRQLLASPNFSESILKYTQSSSPCITDSIPIEQTRLDSLLYEPVSISKSCNPGNKDICDTYELDPCCLSTDLLSHMKQYYPRCERVSICDIEYNGKQYWSRYLYSSLPYQYK